MYDVKKMKSIILADDDPNILEFDVKGSPIIDLPSNSTSLLSMNKLAEKILNSNYLLE